MKRTMNATVMVMVASMMLAVSGDAFAQAPAAPTMRGPIPSSYDKPVSVHASCEPGSYLYYTLDGNDPTIGSKGTLKAKAGKRVFVVCKDLTLKAVCYNKDGTSAAKSGTYVIGSNRPDLDYTFHGDRPMARTRGAHIRVGCWAPKKKVAKKTPTSPPASRPSSGTPLAVAATTPAGAVGSASETFVSRNGQLIHINSFVVDARPPKKKKKGKK